jgi:uncharacterized protein (DUF58 family)
MHTSDLLAPAAIGRLKRLDLRARFIVDGFLAGLHRSARRGRSTEFSDHRAYAWGDDPQDIDWRLYARTEKLFIKMYQAETDMRLSLIVDGSASMHFASRGATLPKFGYASALAAALGWLALRQGDRVGLTVIDDRVRVHIPPRCRRAHYYRMLEALQNCGPRASAVPSSSSTAALGECADLCRRRGLVAVVSDFLGDIDALIEGLRRLRRRGTEVIAFQILDPAERNLPYHGPMVFEDPETGARLFADADRARRAYQAALYQHTDRLRKAAAELAIDFHVMDTETPFDKALMAVLMRKNRGRKRGQVVRG